MKLAHPQLENVLELSGEKTASIVIENQDFFREFLQDIQSQIDGYPGKAVISEKSKLLDWPKSGELIDRFLSFSLNRKPLLTKISAAMEAEAMSESFYSRTVQLLSQVDGYLDDLAFSMDCDVVFGASTISGLLKSAGISLREDYEDPLERLLDYMELIRCFEREKLFVFVNLRSFYSDDAVSRFLQSALAHEYRLLLVDSQEHPYLPEEQRLVIDKDLCEI